LALAGLCEIAEMGYHQGFETFYDVFNKTIKRAFEFTAKYNLGNTVTYALHYDYCEVNLTDYTPEAMSATTRGTFRPIYEMVYNHYVVRKKGTMPYTLQVKQTEGAEGAPPYADHPGFGTLFFYSGTDTAATSAAIATVEKSTTDESAKVKLSVTKTYGKLIVEGCIPNTQVQLWVYDIAGRLLMNNKQDSGPSGSFNKNINLGRGIYIVKVQNEQNSKSDKIFIE
jgi:hypothetical protein